LSGGGPDPQALLREIRRTLTGSGVYLMQDIHSTSHLEKAMMREAGFRSIHIHRLEHDPQNDYYVVRP
jgi:hypothetical protein